jgi:hydrogenase maturation protease
MRRRVLVVCIGNELVADDGVGWVVHHELERLVLPERVRLVFLGLGGIDLLEALDGEDLLVVVDGVQLGKAPGTVHRLGWEQLPHAPSRPVSGHGIGVREALAIGTRLYPQRMPQQTVLLGIEGRCFDRLGDGLSPEVAQAVPEVVRLIVQLVDSADFSCLR